VPGSLVQGKSIWDGALGAKGKGTTGKNQCVKP